MDLHSADTVFQLFNSTQTPMTAISILNILKPFKNLGRCASAFFLRLFPYNVPVLEAILPFFDNPQRESILIRLASANPKKYMKPYLECIDLNRFTSYPSQIVSSITSSVKSSTEPPLVTFTITTCKRLSLFKQTMNSFLNCCVDCDLIGRWICVDDNSSEEDRQEMTKLYPFFEFIFKSQNDKGHARSMNILMSKINSPYVFHMEDDWLFFRRERYLSMCLDVLNDRPNLSQCLINKNYAELPSEIDTIYGGLECKTPMGCSYFVHEHYPRDSKEYKDAITRYGKTYDWCLYWPHYSLRPSLLRTTSLQKIGMYNEKADHFEMEYAWRYVNSGFQSAYLPSIFAKHIGRLTSERFDETKLNAYMLNGEAQFRTKDKTLLDDIQIHIVNLDRRPDRMVTFQKNCPSHLQYTRFSAVDGKKLVSTPQLQRIFEGNDYNMKAGCVGCAMSHLKLWCDIIRSQVDIHLILEDDVTFTPNFREKLIHLISELKKTSSWDVGYVGHSVWKHLKTPIMTDEKEMPSIQQKKKDASLRLSMGGTIGYLINRKGALKLLNFVNRVGMTNCIDTMMQKSGDEVNLYYCEPHLVFSPVCENTGMDSDIQFVADSLTLPTVTRFEDEKKLYDYNFTTLKSIEEAKEYNGTKVGFLMLKEGESESVARMGWKMGWYTIDKKVLVLCPDNVRKKGFLDRLKRDGKFDVDGCLIFKT